MLTGGRVQIGLERKEKLCGAPEIWVLKDRSGGIKTGRKYSTKAQKQENRRDDVDDYGP